MGCTSSSASAVEPSSERRGAQECVARRFDSTRFVCLSPVTPGSAGSHHHRASRGVSDRVSAPARRGGLSCLRSFPLRNILLGLLTGIVWIFVFFRNLAVGIGIQNFPEGLAVSLPLQAAGFSTLKSFWYGQLSGMVEPIAGVLGAAGVGLAAPALPYALSFAAGAMIYVVVDDIIPEAHSR